MLDGNEKFIWLQAASELGRLCSETVKTSVPRDVKWVALSLLLYHFVITISCISTFKIQEAFYSPSRGISEKYFDSSTVC